MFDSDKLSIAEKTYRKLEELIVLTELKPRVMYTERELADFVNSGRTPVREAVQRLSVEGLVEVVRRRGVMITDVDVNQQLGLLSVYRPIHNFLSRHLTQGGSEEDRGKLGQLADDLEKDIEKMPLSRAKILSILRRVGDDFMHMGNNEFVVKTMRVVQGLSRRFWIYHLKPSDVVPAMDLYIKLFRAIEVRDEEKAMLASNAVVDYLEDFAKNTIQWK